jgi:hypothetical protein
MAEATDELPVETPVEPPAEPKVEVPAVAETTESKAEGEAEPKAESKAEGKAEDWRDKRIAKLTAKLHELGEALKTTPKPEASSNVTDDPAEFNRRVEAVAEAKLAQVEFNRACNDVAKAGASTFGKEVFDSRVQELSRLVDVRDPNSLATYNSFLAAAIETGAGEKIIHELGGDLNEASRVLALSPTKMAVELTKLALRAESGNELTKLGKPITPISRKGESHDAIDPSDTNRSDKLSTREWMARRMAQDKERETRH